MRGISIMAGIFLIISSRCFIAATIFIAILTLVPNQWSITQALKTDLISNSFVWKPFSAAIVSQNASDLDIVVVTDKNDKLWNRAYLPIQINSKSNNSALLNLDYDAISHVGNATFLSEVRDTNSSKVLWTKWLNTTNGQSSNQTFTLPKNIVNKPVEFRLYIVTVAPGEHELRVKSASLITP